MAIVIDLFFLVFNLMVLIASETPVPLLIVFFFLTFVLCVFYTYVVFFSHIVVDEARDLIVYRIFKDTIYDLRNVHDVKLETRIEGKRERQVILLLNEKNFTIGEINPYLTRHSLKIMPEIYEQISNIIHRH